MDLIEKQCKPLPTDLLGERDLIIAANRGPAAIQSIEGDDIKFNRIGGGLVTALSGLAQQVDATWIASSSTQSDRLFGAGMLSLLPGDRPMRLRFITPDSKAYDEYYNIISNPLLWFIQHSLWDFPRSPNIDATTWHAWESGYLHVNYLFAKAIAEQVRANKLPSLIMLQDYQLYLVPHFLRQLIPTRRRGNGVHPGSKRYTLTHFIHIPWPGAEQWGILPSKIRRSIVESLCVADLLGFQTREDGRNFLRTCESYLPEAHITFRYGRVWYRNHTTQVRDFPISIDVEALRNLAKSEEVVRYRRSLESRFGERQLIVRVDRIEPSKNILRGFRAYGEMLDHYPEHHGKVMFLAILVPSRTEVGEYQNYLDELMAEVGRVNVKHGDSEWEPVRVLVGENYPRAIAALQLYDVLLVNSIADGMNLVAKEGPIVNQRNGALVLSERTGARQQLETGSIVIPPFDVNTTSEALHQALILPIEERRQLTNRLIEMIERDDITDWLCKQLETLREFNL